MIKIMKTRSGMKAAGHRWVDDVTELNTSLIKKLHEHNSIESAWQFNGRVCGKQNWQETEIPIYLMTSE